MKNSYQNPVYCAILCNIQTIFFYKIPVVELKLLNIIITRSNSSSCSIYTYSQEMKIFSLSPNLLFIFIFSCWLLFVHEYSTWMYLILSKIIQMYCSFLRLPLHVINCSLYCLFVTQMLGVIKPGLSLSTTGGLCTRGIAQYQQECIFQTVNSILYARDFES